MSPGLQPWSLCCLAARLKQVMRLLFARLRRRTARRHGQPPVEQPTHPLQASSKCLFMRVDSPVRDRVASVTSARPPIPAGMLAISLGSLQPLGHFAPASGELREVGTGAITLAAESARRPDWGFLHCVGRGVV